MLNTIAGQEILEEVGGIFSPSIGLELPNLAKELCFNQNFKFDKAIVSIIFEM